MNVLLVGEEDIPHVSSGNLAQALRSKGHEARFSLGVEKSSTREWVRLVRWSDAVVIVSFGGPNAFAVRQLALAASMGRPIIRWWVGSDVLHCVRDERNRKNAVKLEQFVYCNVVVSGHLKQELATIQVKRQFHVIPSLVDLPDVCEKRNPQSDLLPGAVLAYLPTKRSAFYGEKFVRKAIESNPDVHFVVVGDESHVFASYPNAESLGWVDDMDTVWDRIGIVLRMTDHDGLPRIILDALLRERYAIYAWPLAGCWLARTCEEVQLALDRFGGTTVRNVEGRLAVQRLLDPPPRDRFVELISQCVRRRRRVLSFNAILHIVHERVTRRTI